jgi:hypothetical protein
MGTKNVPAKSGGGGVVKWEDRLAKYAKDAVDQEASVATGQFISTRAGQLSYQGNPIKDNTLDVVVADGILENCYYEGEFDAKNPAPPVCYAFGRDDKEMKPHEKSTKKQAESCADCPQNVFGSAERGEGKACKNTRRLALLPTTNMTPDGLKKMEAAYIKVPVTSVKGWAAYTRGIAALRHRPPFGVVTRLKTEPDQKNQFRMTFEHVSDLPESLLPVAMDRHEELKEAIGFPYAPPQENAPKRTAAGGRARVENKPTKRKF